MRKQKQGNSQWLIAILMGLVILASMAMYHYKIQSEATEAAGASSESDEEFILMLGTEGDDDIVRLTETGFERISTGSNMALSPDGNYLAYTNRNTYNLISKIEVFDLRTSMPDQGFRNQFNSLSSEGYYLTDPIWSPNGEKIAVTAVRFDSVVFAMVISRDNIGLVVEGSSVAWYSDSLLIVELDGDWLLMGVGSLSSSDLVDLVDRYTPEAVVNVNGTVLYHDFESESEDEHGIYSVRPGEERQLLIPKAVRPVWSPDGTQFTYTTWEPDGSDEYSDVLWIANADGSNARFLYRTESPSSDPGLPARPHYFGMTWHGDRIYFVTGVGATSQNEQDAMDDTLVSIRNDGSDLQVHLPGTENVYIGDFVVR